MLYLKAIEEPIDMVIGEWCRDKWDSYLEYRLVKKISKISF
jgi:hypothetical protein